MLSNRMTDQEKDHAADSNQADLYTCPNCGTPESVVVKGEVCEVCEACDTK